MAGPFVWWANRKSKHGMQVSAKAPPHLPNGREWWTRPPTSMPQPEHIEYVVQFMLELLARKPSRHTNAMQSYVAAWLRAARSLLHEEAQSPARADLHTTDGLIIAAAAATRQLCASLVSRGGSIPGDVQDVVDALDGRATRLRRQRGIESAKTRSFTKADRERLGR